VTREQPDVFTLKGKPLNVWDLKRDIVYKNDEMSLSPSPPQFFPPHLRGT
jgi:hypothetical protein